MCRSGAELDELLDLALAGTGELARLQRAALEGNWDVTEGGTSPEGEDWDGTAEDAE